MDVGANIFHDRMGVDYVTEDSLKFHLNPTPELGKALHQALGFKRKKFVSWPGNSRELEVDAKNPYLSR